MYDKFYLEGNWYVTKDSDDVKHVYLKTKSKQEADNFHKRLIKSQKATLLGQEHQRSNLELDYAAMQNAVFSQRNIVISKAAKTAFSVTGQSFITPEERQTIYAQYQLSGVASKRGAW